MISAWADIDLFEANLSSIYITQSKKNAQIGVTNEAKKQGMVAAYLNVAAIVAALVVACLVMGLVLGLYGPVYAQQESCNYYYYRSSYYCR